MKKSFRNGFTLIEMLVVVVIISIIASVAIPSFSSLIKNNAMSATTNEIISTMQTARSEAIKRSQNVRVCFVSNLTNPGECTAITSTNSDYIVAYLDLNSDQLFDKNEDILYASNRLNEKVFFISPPTGISMEKSISFGLRGEAIIDLDRSKRETTFGLCDDRKTFAHGRVIKVGKTGRAQATNIKKTDNISC